jgi:Protein of unknown function (DUF4054)
VTTTPAQIRLDFPEFGSTTTYPNSVLQFWLNLFYVRTAPVVRRWGDLLDTGAELYACHNAVMEARAKRAADRGAIPGAMKGAVSAESAGPISQSYDTAGSSMDGWGNYNLTEYGVRFAEIANMVGAGPLTVI